MLLSQLQLHPVATMVFTGQAHASQFGEAMETVPSSSMLIGQPLFSDALMVLLPELING